MDGNVEFLLLLSYAPNGTLTEYLQSKTIDWPTFCKMGLTIVQGLAYLHTELRRGGIVSKNIDYFLQREKNSLKRLLVSTSRCIQALHRSQVLEFS